MGLGFARLTSFGFRRFSKVRCGFRSRASGLRIGRLNERQQSAFGREKTRARSRTRPWAKRAR